MDAVRVVSHCERPFDVAKIIYVHCIDLGTEKFTPVVSFPCLEVCYVLGHFSFPSDLAVRRLCCVLWSDDSKGKLANIKSPVLLSVKSSCYFTVNILFCFVFLSYSCGKRISISAVVRVLSRDIVEYDLVELGISFYLACNDLITNHFLISK